SAVVHGKHDRAVRARTGGAGEVIRPGHHLRLHPDGLQVSDQLAPGIEISLNPLAPHGAVRHRLQILQCLFAAVVRAKAVARDPVPSAGGSGGSAVSVGLFNHQDLEAEFARAQRRSQAGGTRTSDDYVEIVSHHLSPGYWRLHVSIERMRQTDLP